MLASLYERFYNDYKIKEVTIQGIRIKADRNVHKPGKTCVYFANMLKKYIKPTDIVLDVGTGSGVLALLLSKHAKKIVGIEINEKAVICARKNVSLNHIKNVEIRQSDMFKNIRGGEKFDCIIMNPPAFDFPTKKVSDRSYIDTKYHMISSFFKGISYYTKQNSKIFILYPQIWSPILERIAKKHGFDFSIIAQKKNILYRHMLIYYFFKE